MNCPFCSQNHDRVVDSRESRDGASIRRRRECLDCGRRFTSYEQIEKIPYLVVKTDGQREEFSRNKLLMGVMKACEKRPVAARDQEGVVEEIEQLLHQKVEREISTREIGGVIMERLRELDHVAYVRFASVYRQFQDIGAFVDEVQNLLNQPTPPPSEEPPSEEPPSEEPPSEEPPSAPSDKPPPLAKPTTLPSAPSGRDES